MTLQKVRELIAPEYTETIVNTIDSRVASAVTDLVGNAPATLDTIGELAAALQALSAEDINGLVAILDRKVDVGVVGNLPSLQTTNKSSIVSAINEVFQGVDSGKTLVGNAITTKGGTVPSNPTFQQLATAIGDIQTGQSAQGTGTTISTDIYTTFDVGGLSFTPSAVYILYEGSKIIIAVKTPIDTRPSVVINSELVSSVNNILTFRQGGFNLRIPSSNNPGTFRYVAYS